MIYLFENPNNDASIVYDETTLSDTQKSKGVAVADLPEPQTPQGKQAVLKVKKSTGDIWYEYADIQKDETQQQLDVMQKAIDDLILGGML